MNKLIILATLFLTSCANNQYKRHSWATVKYTVREYYLPVESKPSEKLVKNKSKPSKSVKKKANRLDCDKVFKEVNQCMKQ